MSKFGSTPTIVAKKQEELTDAKAPDTPQFLQQEEEEIMSDPSTSLQCATVLLSPSPA